ncbi:DNA-directed DNA polymerase [Tanacetum coccineum]
MVTMNEWCSAVLLNKLSSKEKDPWSFTIPCQVSHLQINNALADLGASISLMPYTIYANLDKFVLPIDFVILDMPEDSRISIILGRPFLTITRARIDVFNKKITLRVGDDEVISDMEQLIKKPPTKDDECHGFDDLDDTMNIETHEFCNSIGDEFDNNSDVDLSIRHIDPVNTPYYKAQETEGTDRVKNKHLYSSSANDIDEEKLELEDLPCHLEYAYLHGTKSFLIIISSKLSEEEKISLLQVLKKRKGAEDLAANHLSRLENPHKEVLIEREIADEFPNKHLMFLKSKFNDDEPWVVEIIDRDGFNFKVNGQRLKKYYEGNIDKEDDEFIEFENGVT